MVRLTNPTWMAAILLRDSGLIGLRLSLSTLIFMMIDFFFPTKKNSRFYSGSEMHRFEFCCQRFRTKMHKCTFFYTTDDEAPGCTPGHKFETSSDKLRCQDHNLATLSWHKLACSTVSYPLIMPCYVGSWALLAHRGYPGQVTVLPRLFFHFPNPCMWNKPFPTAR